MKFMRLLILISLLIASFAAVTPADELVWYDEFDGTTIDPTKWDKPEYNRRQNSNGPDGWWLREESFLDGDGHLIIRAQDCHAKIGSFITEAHDRFAGEAFGRTFTRNPKRMQSPSDSTLRMIIGMST